jgi:hypothetical protein
MPYISLHYLTTYPLHIPPPSLYTRANPTTQKHQISRIWQVVNHTSLTQGARRATTATPRGRGEALSTYAGTPTRDQARAAVEFTPSRREDTRQIDALREQTAALENTVVELEKERDFYYGKLRAVELLCQATEEDGGVMPGALGIARDILELMYRDTPGVEAGEEVEPGAGC